MPNVYLTLTQNGNVYQTETPVGDDEVLPPTAIHIKTCQRLGQFQCVELAYPQLPEVYPPDAHGFNHANGTFVQWRGANVYVLQEGEWTPTGRDFTSFTPHTITLLVNPVKSGDPVYVPSLGTKRYVVVLGDTAIIQLYTDGKLVFNSPKVNKFGLDPQGLGHLVRATASSKVQLEHLLGCTFADWMVPKGTVDETAWWLLAMGKVVTCWVTNKESQLKHRQKMCGVAMITHFDPNQDYKFVSNTTPYKFAVPLSEAELAALTGATA